MDPLSPVDRPAVAERPPASQRFSGRASGTRRIVSRERAAAPGEPAPERHTEQDREQPPPARWASRALDGCFALDTRLRGRLLWLLVGGAAAAGGAVPLSLSWSGAEQGRAPLIAALQLLALLLAGLVWVARCQSKAEGWRRESVRHRLAALPRRWLLDARLLRGAPKRLKLSILSRWTQAAGIIGLVCSTVPGVAAQLLGYAAGPVLGGLSLWSASLLLLSELLRWALRVQAPPRRLPAAELALAAREFSPVVDLSRPLQIESVFLEPTPLHALMVGLSMWRCVEQWHTPEDHALALQHHLWATSMPDAQLTLQRRLERDASAGVADLVVDDAVLVDFQLGLRRADVEQVAERVRGYRRAWGDEPIVLVVCSAGSGELPCAAALDALAAQRELGSLIVARSCQAPAAVTAERASAS